MRESIKNDRKDGKVMMELLPWPESGINHLAHVAWNAIAMLHCKMEEYNKEKP